jgi:SET domain-containing protein
MELILPTKIIVKSSETHGLGVFAKENIKKGEIIEECPFLKLPIEMGQRSTLLMNHRFAWPKGSGPFEHVVAMGYASYYNHSNEPNADWDNNFDNETFLFTALKDIKKGEEIFVWYGDDNYWSDGRSDIEIK